MQTVFNNSMTAHMWAQRSQEAGRNSTGALYFEGNTIYSYGRHFPIAKFYDLKGRSEPVVLITTRQYSNTTTAHVSLVASAVSHYKCLYVPDPLGGAGNRAAMVEEFEGLLIKATRARKHASYYLSEAERLLTQINDYSRLFGLRRKPLTMPADMQAIKEQVAKQAAALAKANARARKAKAKKDAEHVANWLNHNPLQYALYGIKKVYLRLSRDGNTIETSHGAQCPVAFAAAIWKQVKKCHSTGQAWHTNGHTIKAGNFEVSSIDSKGNLTAGCHFIQYDQLQSMATVLKLEE